MKKSNFVALILGTVSGILFALGMCMALLPEWDAFTQGIILGAAGIVLGIITLLVWRKMENKAPVKFNARAAFITAFTVLGALILGVGMCLCLVWSKFIIGTIVGIVGIVMLLCLIPMIKGIK
ncbi:MAG: hypothetical protein J6I80_02905 [Clostridia bacterium]|nr:hypothetical protein [Clostridia bacterium]